MTIKNGWTGRIGYDNAGYFNLSCIRGLDLYRLRIVAGIVSLKNKGIMFNRVASPLAS